MATQQAHTDSFRRLNDQGTHIMTSMTIEEKIRARAYELWQLDGELEGCADEYWYLARTLVENELRQADTNEPGKGNLSGTD